MRSPLLRDLEARGLIADVANGEELDAHLLEADAPRTIYVGFDPTADSLHVGSLLPLLALRRVQLAGHRPIVLVGGGTGLIGDPSGKAGERHLNPVEQVAAWAERLKAQVRSLLDFDGGLSAAILVDNYAWLSRLEVITFLRDIGKHFAVGAMVARESVKSRIGRADVGISYTEFSYQILQAYDFMALADRYDCTVQFGGSDQWGNITAGIELIRRVRGRAAYGLTLPLVTKEGGTKFGKTETGTVWLDPEKTSAYEMYQFWLNTADADVVRFLKYFTFLSLEEIDDLARRTAEAPERREAQRVLARHVTALVHGTEAVREAERTAAAVFQAQPVEATEGRPVDGGALPLVSIQASEPRFLWSILKEAGIVASASEARRLIAQGGVAVNRHRVPGVEFKLGEGQHLVQIGKRRFWRVLVGPGYETRPWQKVEQKKGN
jgi:tyrosyl-tRNA synthetase